jgi:cation transport protein ChaC
LTQDAFVHLPHLRDRLTPVEQSPLRFTREVLAARDERAREAGYPANWRQSDQQIDTSWRGFLSGRVGSGDLWVFGYGSLMWDPGIHHTEVRLAEIDGYQRRFTVRIEVITGSPEHPGLALSLEQQPGRCRGLAFRIAADLVEAESEFLWRREMILFSYSPVMVPVATPQGSITALVFASDRLQPKYVGELPLNETATIIAHGRGIRGDSRTYVAKLADELKLLEIEDPYVEQLLQQINNINAPLA